MSTLASTLIRDYICRICHANLKMIPGRDENGNTVVVCAKDASHTGFWRKSYLERRRQIERVEGAEIAFDPMWREILELPELPPIAFEEAVADLFY